VFPAHFEGSCGKGMCGRPTSTIGYERRFNPMLQLSPDDFVAAVSETPARPLNMSAIIPTNRGEASVEWAQPQMVEEPPRISVAEGQGWLQAHDAVVIDVREPFEYEQVHLPRAVSLPQADVANKIETLPKDRDLLIVCAGGVRSLRVAHYLRWYGFERVTSLDGGTNGWVQAGLPTEGGHLQEALAAKEDHYFHAAS
jgi:rhodanese-related sulfurtransferase